MEFIKAEEFKKQSEKVQNTLMGWYKPNIGDLIGIKMECIDSLWNTVTKYKVSCINEDDIFNYDSKEELLDSFKTFGEHSYSDEIIPLLTESQLRKFIEEHYKYIETNNFKDKKQIVLVYKDLSQIKPSIECSSNDLLKAYWKVACKIAEDI